VFITYNNVNYNWQKISDSWCTAGSSDCGIGPHTLLSSKRETMNARLNNGLEERVESMLHPIGQEMTGSEIYRHTLEMLGIEKVGAYIGGRVIDLLDKVGKSSALELMSGPHEQDLGHVLQGYYKIARKPGVLIVTSGPGGTNTATPLQDALSDGDGLIVTVGQVSLESLADGEESFQGAVMVETLGGHSKWAYRITRAEDIQRALKTAYHVATDGRPGSVLLELPSPIAQHEKTLLKDIGEVAMFPVPAKEPALYGNIDLRRASIEDATNALSKAERPVIIAGNGVHHANASKLLTLAAEKYDTPFMPTLPFLGAAMRHSLNKGMPGMHGSVANNLAIYHSDVLIYLGGRLDDRVIGNAKQFAPHAQIYWMDPHQPGIGRAIAERVIKVDGDAKESLEAFLRKSTQCLHPQWSAQITAWEKEYPMPSHSPGMLIQSIRQAIEREGQPEPYVATGVGAHQMFVAQYWKFDGDGSRNYLLTSGGLGTMGTGIPFGVGAMHADPTRPVYVFNGDGSMMMDQRSLSMAWKLQQENKDNYGLKVVLFRDNTLGMVDHWQNEAWGGRKTLSDVDLPKNYFKHMARMNHFRYFSATISDPHTMPTRTIGDFVNAVGNAMFEVRLSPQGVFPMIPAGTYVGETKLPRGERIDPIHLEHPK
jgi:acetolactate synthase I/II/III large subunit